MIKKLFKLEIQHTKPYLKVGDKNSFDLISQINQGLKKDKTSSHLALFIGLGLITAFLTLVSLAPQVGEKLGTLSVKKHKQQILAYSTITSSQFEENTSGQVATPPSSAQTAPQNFTVNTVEIQNFLDLLNAYRQQNGLGTLTSSLILSNAAAWMANDMATYNYVNEDYVKNEKHIDSLGRDMPQRLDAFGYTHDSVNWTKRAENMAGGFETAQTAFEALKNSAKHNVNQLNPDFTAVGISRAFNQNSTYHWYWLMDFGDVIDTPVIYTVPTPTPSPTPTPTPTPTSASISASPNPCPIPSTQNNCSTTVSWNTAGYSSVFVCRDDGSGETKIAQGLSGNLNQSLSWDKTYRFDLRTATNTTCGQGTLLSRIYVPVVRINVTAGDVNCSGTIDNMDVLHMLYYLAGLRSYTQCPGGGFLVAAADFFADGQINTKDLLFILRKSADMLELNPLRFTSLYHDNDTDLMTNSEEDSYGCLNPNDYDTHADPDGDSLTGPKTVNMDNFEEIAYGTNPCNADTDGDGFKDSVEVYLGTDPKDPCGDGSPSKSWPADLVNSGLSANKIDIQDLSSYTVPIRRINTSPGDPGYDKRWDLVPGSAAGKEIGIADLAFLNMFTAPMLNGQKAWNGPACTP